jgi:hypothetical protein
MRSIVKAITGTGQTVWIPLDTMQNPFNVGFGVVASGTITYSVEHTFDDVASGVSATAFAHPIVAAQTASKDGNYAFPVKAVRINVTAGTGTATITLVQAGGGC